MTLLIILGIIVVLGIMIASMYNSLVKLRNNRENAFADIDVQLKQRHDLIPQLVDTVKGYASHEKETLDRVIQARNGAINARTIDDKDQCRKQLSFSPYRFKNYARSISGLESQSEFSSIARRNLGYRK